MLHAHPELNRPSSKVDLFLSFTALALQGFGGVLAVAQRELVEKKRWMTPEQFVDDWAVAQILPGPNVVNLSMMVGGRHFGLPGALAAVAGMLTFPLLLVLLLALLYSGVADNAQVQGALRGMGAVAAGLVAGTGVKLIAALKHNAMGRAACVAWAIGTFVAIALMRWPLVWVLPLLGGTACGWAYGVLARAEPTRASA